MTKQLSNTTNENKRSTLQRRESLYAQIMNALKLSANLRPRHHLRPFVRLLRLLRRKSRAGLGLKEELRIYGAGRQFALTHPKRTKGLHSLIRRTNLRPGMLEIKKV